MKKIILVLSFYFLCRASLSQVFIYGGYNNLFTNYPSFDEHVSTFNQFFNNYYGSDVLEEDLTSFPHSSGYCFGLSWNMFFFTSDIGYNHLSTSTSAKYINDCSRYYDLYLNNLNIGIGFGYGTNENFGIWATGSMILGRQTIKSYYKYPDGSIDIGVQGFTADLNGIYSESCLRWSYGLKTSFTLNKYIRILARAEMLTKSTVALADEHASKMDLYSNSPMCIPSDYVEYNNNVWYFSEGGEVVRCDAKGPIFTLGMQFNVSSLFQ